MKKQLFLRPVFAALFFLLLFSAILIIRPAPVAAEDIVVVAFGDSITRGIGGIVPYPAQLQSLLGNCAVVINQGVRGEWTKDGVNRIGKVLATNNPTHIIIMEGANDAIFGVSASTVKFNLSVMISKAKAQGTIPILSTVTPNRRDSGTSSVIPLNYNPSIRALAGEKGVQLVDQYQNVVAEWGMLSLDGVHPTTEGAGRIAAAFASVLPCGGSGGVGGVGGGGGGCFIATAAFGTPLEPQVELLKKFRDQYLLTNSLGTAFVQNYYQYSPPVAEYIARHESLRYVVRLALYPLIGFAYFMIETGFMIKISSIALLLVLTLASLAVRSQLRIRRMNGAQ